MEKKWVKTKIGVGYVVKAKVGEMGWNTRKIIIRRMRRELVVCSQAVMCKNQLLFQLQNVQKKDMSSCSLLFLCSKEEVEMYEPLYNYPKNNKVNF